MKHGMRLEPANSDAARLAQWWYHRCVVSRDNSLQTAPSRRIARWTFAGCAALSLAARWIDPVASTASAISLSRRPSRSHDASRSARIAPALEACPSPLPLSGRGMVSRSRSSRLRLRACSALRSRPATTLSHGASARGARPATTASTTASMRASSTTRRSHGCRATAPAAALTRRAMSS
jgi:hypothetical protein